MKTKKFITKDQAIKAGNNGKNQDIKSRFVSQHVYCNVNSMAEYCLSKGFEDYDSPISYDCIENYYSYPEWSKTVLGDDLYFGSGTEDDKNKFLEEFDRLEEESSELLENEKISDETHERNLEIIQEAKEEFENLESEPQEIYEWWAISEFMYRNLKDRGYCVVDAGSCYVWGRGTSGQAILLDYVITLICADMGILEGQENAYPIQIKEEKQTIRYTEEHLLDNGLLSLSDLRKFVDENDTFSISERETGQFSYENILTAYKQRLETDEERDKRVSKEKAYMEEYNKRKDLRK